MRLWFLYDKKREERNLFDIYDKYEWFVNNKFPINLPSFYSSLFKKYKNNKKLFRKALKTNFDKIYNTGDYLLKIEKVRNSWQKIEKEFIKIVNNLNLEIIGDYHCYISMYGPEGQFKTPNTISLRVSNVGDIKNANETIAHELIHLFIYNKVEKLKLNYQETEGMVDLFFTETNLYNIFPNYTFQNIGIHDKKSFQKLFKINK